MTACYHQFVQKSQPDKAPYCLVKVFSPGGPDKVVKHDEKLISINVQPTASEWLSKSVVVQLNDITTTEMVQKAFIENNFSDVVLRLLGGLNRIVTFKSKEDRKMALNNNLIKGWFQSFKPWNGQAAGKPRLVWIKCKGIPLNTWGALKFK